MNLNRSQFPKLALVVLFAITVRAQEKGTPLEIFDAQKMRGTIVPRVVCSENAAQSYAVYLPSQYSPDHAWPVLYVFDPFARGKTAVEVYQAAAEKFGYIVVGSNNSKNGPVAPQLEAAQAMWNDTHRRFVIDKARAYSSGLSGGARTATAFALYCFTCRIAGVIAHGAGYPAGIDPKQPGDDHFAFYAAVGDQDFNYPELAALRKQKDDQGAPFKVKVYPGPHQWAPPEIAEDALAWLDLKAMQNGGRSKDPALVRKLYEATQAEAAQAAQHGDTLAEYYALRSLVMDFKGLEETAPFEGKLAALKQSKPWKSALQREQRDIDLQRSLTATTAGDLVQLGAAELETQSALAQRIAVALSDLRRRSREKNRESVIYSRAFTQLWIQGIETGQDQMRNGHSRQAVVYFELMSDAAPDQAWPAVLLAQARVRAGNKKGALKALDEASHRGLKHPEALAEDPELQPLASEPEFQRIVHSGPK